MFTRQDYMQGLCTHQEYYHQFVDEHIKSYVLKCFSIEKLRKAYEKDEHFNTISLSQWDFMTSIFTMFPNHPVKTLLKECGDYYTLSHGVCILKQAAQELIEEEEANIK